MAENSKKALNQFKELVGKLPRAVGSKTQSDKTIKSKLTRERHEVDVNDLEEIERTTRTFEDKGVMVDTTETTNPELIPGLSPNEIRLLRGVLLPSDTMDTSTGIGPKGALKIQADNFSEAIGYLERQI